MTADSPSLSTNLISPPPAQEQSTNKHHHNAKQESWKPYGHTQFRQGCLPQTSQDMLDLYFLCAELGCMSTLSGSTPSVARCACLADPLAIGRWLCPGGSCMADAPPDSPVALPTDEWDLLPPSAPGLSSELPTDSETIDERWTCKCGCVKEAEALHRRATANRMAMKSLPRDVHRRRVWQELKTMRAHLEDGFKLWGTPVCRDVWCRAMYVGVNTLASFQRALDAKLDMPPADLRCGMRVPPVLPSQREDCAHSAWDPMSLYPWLRPPQPGNVEAVVYAHDQAVVRSLTNLQIMDGSADMLETELQRVYEARGVRWIELSQAVAQRDAYLREHGREPSGPEACTVEPNELLIDDLEIVLSYAARSADARIGAAAQRLHLLKAVLRNGVRRAGAERPFPWPISTVAQMSSIPSSRLRPAAGGYSTTAKTASATAV